MKKRKTERSAAIVTIRDAAKMTKKGRRQIAEWLKRTAADLVELGHKYDGGFRARYLY